MAQGTLNQEPHSLVIDLIRDGRFYSRLAQELGMLPGMGLAVKERSMEDRLRDMGFSRANRPDHEGCAKMRRRYRDGKFGHEKPEVFNDVAIGTSGIR